MSNTIQIKSGSGKPGNGVLKKAELGYDTTNGYLYIGNSSNQTAGIKVETANGIATWNKKTEGLTWITDDGTKFWMRPYSPNNLFQIVRFSPGSSDGKATFNINNEGQVSFGEKPLNIASGGTGATTAAAALTNLGITATAAELNYVDGVTSSIQTQINSNKTAASNAQSTANTAQASANTAQGRADSAYTLASTANSTANTANSTANAALPKAGGTITGVLKHEGNHYVHKTSNSSGNSYYMKFATIKITGNYLNQEIHFKLIHRGDRITNVYVCYHNGDTTTPSLNYIQTDCIDVWIHNEGSGVWGLYASAWAGDSVEVLDFTTGKYASDKMTVTWLNTTTSSLPSGAVLASTRPLPSRYYGDTLPSSAPAGAIFFKKV